MSHDTWIHRTVRAGVRPLVGTPVRPNHLTSLRLASGVGASALLASGSAAWIPWGAGLLLASLLLDRADGELARLSARPSRFGHLYDLVSDGACNALLFLGLGLGLRGGPMGPWAPPLGLLAGAAVAGILLLTLRSEALAGEGAAELSGLAGFDPDDAMFLVPLLLWAGARESLLLAAALGAPLFGVFFLWKLHRDGPRGRAGASLPGDPS